MHHDGRDNGRQKTIVSLAAAIATAFVLLLLTMCQSGTPNEAAQLHDAPPTLYDQTTGEPIPATQQWMVPLEGKDTALVSMEDLTGNNGWISPTIDYTSDNNSLNMFVDYAGKEVYGSGTSQVYSALKCMSTDCFIQHAAGSYVSNVSYRVDSLTTDKTIYEPNHAGNSSLFYSYIQNTRYKLDTPAELAVRINASLADKHKLSWMRITIHEHPVGLQKLNFFLTAKYQIFFKCLLLLIPLLMLNDYRVRGGFHSKQALVTGSLLMLWGGINTIIWDINYVVVSCVFFAFSGMFYSFANNIYKLVYVLGYFILLVFAYKYNAGFNKHFVMQTGLAGLIGIGLIVKEPE